MANKSNFNENTRVQIPAALHLVRLGYTYLSHIADTDYHHASNTLLAPLHDAIARLNPQLTSAQVGEKADELLRTVHNTDLGREFFKLVTSTSGTKYIDFNNPDNNTYHVTTEFTCRDERTDDNFRPDLTVFVNGLPLVFIEVKKPNNHQGILAERDRINTRFRNPAFRTFFNATQFMIFSNNQEYNTDSQVPISGAFYATTSSKKAFFNVFREEDPALLSHCGFQPQVDETVEMEILRHRNCPQLRALPEYKTNQDPNTPTNRTLTSMLSRERLLFILRYGIAYVEREFENSRGEKCTELQKHIMRYQQLFATYAIRRKLDEGVNSGIIWHTQGSGKTALAYYNVKSITDYYACRNTVAKFYFIVDRLDLLEQAASEFKMRGLIVRTAQSRKELMADFADSTPCHNPEGKPEIMVVNIQRFAEDRERITPKQLYSINLRRIFFIDEAHRGYNPRGSFLANLFDADKQSVKIALTGTPLLIEERESWRVFGDYIHTYYYDKSISDGYTLKLMREDIETIYKEEITAIVDRLTDEIKVKKSDIDHDAIIEHPSYIKGILRYIFHDLRRSRIQQDAPHMAGMIVCETNTQARNVFQLIQEQDTWLFAPSQQSPAPAEQEPLAAEPALLWNVPQPLKASLILHDEGDKFERKGSIDLFKKTDDIDLLVVNRMLLTGFDAPRLKKLYLTRSLNGHDLLQALTRVNRPYLDFKYGYVVDFADIKNNFVDTNNRYMRELNRTTEQADSAAETAGAGNALMVSNNEVITQMQDIKSTLFQYTTEDVELFRQQLDTITDKEQLYTLLHTLDDAKALTNQVRSFGDDELKTRFEALKVDSIPCLMSEVRHRIESINLLSSTDHKADVAGIIREALSMMEFEFRKRGDEELQIVYNDLRERYEKVETEFHANIDTEADDYITLAEAFRKYFAKRGFTPDTVAEAKEDIGYIDSVMAKIQAINRANRVLQSKYANDEKFVRIHKRIREENEERTRRTPPQRPIISQSDMEIARGLNAVKQGIDRQVLLDYHKLDNTGYFDQLVLSNLSLQLTDLDIVAPLADRRWMQSRIASEYLESYRNM
ncbi:MAG: type I restriction endonuclease subunit R [Bacteroidales bacterium]|nr:type I restriction endonuclease subunit R [Candidatus Colimorpha merdihippi]